jgi:general secretion pathway protein L
VIRRFFSWWGRQLAAMLPASWTRSREREGSVLEIWLLPQEIVFKHQAGGDSDELGRIERGGKRSAGEAPARDAVHAVLHGLRPEKTRCEVRVDEALRLQKTVSLPLAAEENLRQVLAFEMERHTPFHADSVYFGHRVSERDAKNRKLEVDLLVVQKPTVDEALSVLDDWDLKPAPQGDIGDNGALTFLPRVYRAPATSSINRILLVLNLVALSLAALIPIYHQERYLGDLRTRVDAARAAAMVSVQVQDQIYALRQRAAALAGAKSDRPGTVEFVEEVTRLMPDGTWLNRLEIRDGEMRVQGLSGTASALVGVVESSELFRDARFGSPITRDARTGQERFNVSAKLAPGQRAAAESGAAGDKEG